MSNYVWPVPGGRLSSRFGPRKPPKPGASSYHNGIDIAASAGTPIIAARPGKVILKSYNSARGNYIKIDHGGGIVTLYQHAKSFSVSSGTKVSAGQRVGSVGSTGISTGPHLHFEVQVNGTPKNPLNYVSTGDTKYTGPASGGSSPPSSGTDAGSYGEIAQEQQSKEITTVVSTSVSGTSAAQKNVLTGLPAHLAYGVEIAIQHDKIYLPAVEKGVTLERTRKGAPSKLVFTVLKDDVLNFQEGNPVTLRFNGKPVFAGFVFRKERSNYLEIKVTCYDQIRYLKNKSTFSYANKTYGELLSMLAKDFHLSCGSVADTKYKISHRIEEGTLLDALQNASDLTVLNTGTLFVLYDDFGKLALKPLKDMILNILVDEETASKYDYASTIDKETYNKVVLAVDNDQTGQRETHTLNDAGNQAKWGVLQYYEKVSAETTSAVLQAKSKVLLKYYNKKRRTLKISGVAGDIRVRGGSLLVVKMGLGDIDVQNYMCVEKVTHHFEDGLHTMDLSLSGVRGEFMTE